MPARFAWALAAAGAAAHAAPAAAPVVPGLAAGFGLPTRLERLQGVALTFDDGPHPAGTPAVLEVLAAARAPATFFLVGEQVERQPSLAAEIAAEGHDIALHCRRHRNLLRLTPRQIRDDLDRAAATIADATGRAPLLHRPPYGIFSASGLRIVRRRGWEPLLWSRWGRDWAASATAGSIAARATRGLRAGDVILLHDSDAYSSPASWRQTVASLPLILERLADLGLAAVRID
jgi:peptidoglycan/xylan/chitin deacetylase (PgdA/CDA1 family)